MAAATRSKRRETGELLEDQSENPSSRLQRELRKINQKNRKIETVRQGSALEQTSSVVEEVDELPFTDVQTRWCKKVGEESGGSGARWKAHQRVVKRLVGVRRWPRRVAGRVPDGKHTNESLNDSLVQEKGGRRKKVGEESCGSGARWKAHQRVVKRLVGARKGREAAGERGGSGARWKGHQRVVKRLVGVRRCARRVVGRVPDGKHTNESLNDSLV